ncbi:fumarylacetoacetate hydrolase family protein [Actinomadura geliboluensis]|uniref:fumarylacetoacetate hydrolase family protein n=1 Tax=Actinomadura geliboluensis TaxID=882440 RepID=UPI003715EF56
MGWTFEELAAYASRGAELRPGDVLGSGTCGNGGCLAELWGRAGAQDPPPLSPGDVVTLRVEGIGAARPAAARPQTAPGTPVNRPISGNADAAFSAHGTLLTEMAVKLTKRFSDVLCASEAANAYGMP